jgi:hypothetical protein
MPAITRSQTKLQKQMQMQEHPDNIIDKTYNIDGFIIGIMNRAANITNNNIDSDFDSFMKKYADNDRFRLHQKYPELDIVKVRYDILVLCYYNDNDNEKHDAAFVYIALPKNLKGNIEDIDLNGTNISHETELNLISWTIYSIKQCKFK